MLFGNFKNWLSIGSFPSFPCSFHQVWIEWLISTKFNKDRVSKILAFSKACQNRQLAMDRDFFSTFLREKLKYLSNLVRQENLQCHLPSVLTWIGKQTQNSCNSFFLLLSVWQNVSCLVYYTTAPCNAIANGNTRSLRCSKESQTWDPVCCDQVPEPSQAMSESRQIISNKEKPTINVTLLAFIIICFCLCQQTWTAPSSACCWGRETDILTTEEVSSLCSSPNSAVVLWTLGPEGNIGKNFSSY